MPSDVSLDRSLTARAGRTIVIADMVESVRLIQSHEREIVQRWSRLISELTAEQLPKHCGRLVKSLGDGFLLEFEDTTQAAHCVFAIHALVQADNDGRSEDSRILLRIGMHVTDVLVDGLDVYGSGVNLAARLAGLAKPGSTVASAQARDCIVPDLDAEVVDMGDCWLRHLPEPVRAFSIAPVNTGQRDQLYISVGTGDLKPSVAVVPLRPASTTGADAVFGELIADRLIERLSTAPSLKVVSRLSTAALSGRQLSARHIGEALRSAYVVSGTFSVEARRISVSIEVADARSESILYVGRAKCTKADLLRDGGGAISSLAAAILEALSTAAMRELRTFALPNIESFSLLLGSIGLLHRSSKQDFLRAGEALQELVQRLPRHAVGYAWLAKWHALQIIRGLASEPLRERAAAQVCISAALERDDASALAWSISGLVEGFLGRDLVTAERCYERAIDANPSEPLAWLFTGTLRAWQGRGDEAVEAASRALELSPIDPMQYYFESLAAAAYLAQGEFLTAIELCRRSLRLNRLHTPTLRVLAISQMLSGDLTGARGAVDELKRLEPTLTVGSYLRRYPGGAVPHAAVYAEALSAAGLPH